MKSKGFVKMLVLSLAVVATLPAIAQDGVLNQEQDKTSVKTQMQETVKIPAENIDGTKADRKAQDAAIKTVGEYQAAKEALDADKQMASLKAMEDLRVKHDKNLAVLTWLGYMYMDTGQYALATEALELVRGKSSSQEINVSNLKNLGLSYYLSQNYTQAINALSELNNLQPGKADTMALLGSSYVLTEDYSNAITPLEGAREKLGAGESSRSISIDLANSYEKTGKKTELIKLLDEMKSDQDLTADQLGWMGYQYLENDRLNSSVEVLERAVALDPENRSVLNNLAGALSMRGMSGDNERALAYFIKLSDLEPNNPTVAYNAGTILLDQENYAKAKDYLLRAVSANRDAQTLNNLGRAYEGLGDMKNAATNYAAASDMAMSDEVYALNAGAAYQEIEDQTNANKYFARAKRNGANDAALDLNLAISMTRAGQHQQAYDLLTSSEVQSKMRGDSDYWFNLGVVAGRLEKMDEATSAYQRCLQIKPNDQDALNNLGVILFQQEKYAEALAQFKKLTGDAATAPQTRLNIAACHAKLGQRAAAIEIWREFIRQYPSNATVRLNLADALWNSGDTPGARFHYAEVSKSQPNNARALNGLGLWALLQNETAEAESLFRRAIRADRTFLEAYLNLAISLERLNRVADAKKVLEAALIMNSNYKDAKDMLARLNS